MNNQHTNKQQHHPKQQHGIPPNVNMMQQQYRQVHPQQYYQQQQMMYHQYYMQQQYYANMQMQQHTGQVTGQQVPVVPSGQSLPAYQPYKTQQYQTPYTFNQHSPQQTNQKRGYTNQNNSQHHPPARQREEHQRQKPSPSRKRRPQEDQDSPHSQQQHKVKLNPVLNTPQQIKRWIESRKRNYPTQKRIKQKEARLQRQEQTGEVPNIELSKLEIKLRKQIQFSSCSSRSFETKAKNLDIIRCIITEPLRKTKPIRKREYQQQQSQRTVNTWKKPLRPAQQKGSDEDVHNPNQGQKHQEEVPIENPMTSEELEKSKIGQLIQSLKARRLEEQATAEKMFNYRENSSNYKYMKNTLVANMLLEDVFKENCYLLQAIRYIIKSDFLEKQEDQNIQVPIIEVSEHSSHNSQDQLVELEEGQMEEGEWKE